MSHAQFEASRKFVNTPSGRVAYVEQGAGDPFFPAAAAYWLKNTRRSGHG
jgi:hypothetical protein